MKSRSIFYFVVYAIRIYTKSKMSGATLFILWFRDMKLLEELRKSGRMLKNLRSDNWQASVAWWIPAEHVKTAKMDWNNFASMAVRLHIMVRNRIIKPRLMADILK